MKYIEKELYELFCFIPDNDGKYHIQQAISSVDLASAYLDFYEEPLTHLEKTYIYTMLFEIKDSIINHKNKQIKLIKLANDKVDEKDIIYDQETENILKKINDIVPDYWNAKNFVLPNKDELMELIRKRK